jgi:hypothetical protein
MNGGGQNYSAGFGRRQVTTETNSQVSESRVPSLDPAVEREPRRKREEAEEEGEEGEEEEDAGYVRDHDEEETGFVKETLKTTEIQHAPGQMGLKRRRKKKKRRSKKRDRKRSVRCECGHETVLSSSSSDESSTESEDATASSSADSAIPTSLPTTATASSRSPSSSPSSSNASEVSVSVRSCGPETHINVDAIEIAPACPPAPSRSHLLQIPELTISPPPVSSNVFTLKQRNPRDLRLSLSSSPVSAPVPVSPYRRKSLSALRRDVSLLVMDGCKECAERLGVDSRKISVVTTASDVELRPGETVSDLIKDMIWLQKNSKLATLKNA